jgi:hypothetical protein
LADDLRPLLQADLRTAMKARDAATVAILRATLGAIGNAEAVDEQPRPVGSDGPLGAHGLYGGDVDRRELTERDVVEVIRRERTELLDAADDLARHADAAQHADRIEDLRTAAAVLDRYLARG